MFAASAHCTSTVVIMWLRLSSLDCGLGPEGRFPLVQRSALLGSDALIVE